MGIPSVNKLEPMPKTQTYKLKAPHTLDLKRRQDEMLKSVEGNVFPVCESKGPTSNSIFHKSGIFC